MKQPWKLWISNIHFQIGLKNMATVRENAILQLHTNSGLVWVKPGQWVVKDRSDNLHILDSTNFTEDMRL